MFSPHAQANSSSVSKNAASKVFLALAMACISAFLMSCRSYDQPNYGAYQQQPAQAYAQDQRVQTPSYGQQAYPYVQAPTTYSVSNNPITNRAKTWAQQAQSRKPVYPTSNRSQGDRGKRRLPNATTGVFGTTPQQLPPNYRQPSPVAAPVAQQRMATPQPHAAANWQQSPTYPQQPAATGYPSTAAAPAGYGPVNQTQGTGYSNAGYAPYPAATSGSNYIIQKGDSLSVIANRNNVPLGTLLEVNDLSMDSVIHPQQSLTIPGR